MAQNDAPVTLFRSLYRMAVAGGVLLAIFVLVWLSWTLFTRSPVGTAQSTSLDVSLPTRTALAELVPAPNMKDAAFKPPAQCWACHTTASSPCPNLAGVGDRAPDRIASAEYTGDATTAAEYILESIQTPSKFVVPGFPDHVMPPCGGLPDCSDDAVMPYVRFLLTYEGG
jgi:cytochrome c5